MKNHPDYALRDDEEEKSCDEPIRSNKTIEKEIALLEVESQPLIFRKKYMKSLEELGELCGCKDTYGDKISLGYRQI